MVEPAGSDDRVNHPTRPWCWSESLGGIDPDRGRTYEVRRIVFDLVRNRCARLGLEQGMTVRCRRRDRTHVVVELPDGTVVPIESTYARFVEVAPVESCLELGSRA